MRVIGKEAENRSVLRSIEGKHGYVNPGVSHIEGQCASGLANWWRRELFTKERTRLITLFNDRY
jgi:hypothetical protein